MIKTDPIIAVANVEASSAWYQTVFDCRSKHGGKDFDILVDDNGEVLICLHKWGEHNHPTMRNFNIISGNGLIIYFRTTKMKIIRENIKQHGFKVEEEIHLNPNSLKLE